VKVSQHGLAVRRDGRYTPLYLTEILSFYSSQISQQRNPVERLSRASWDVIETFVSMEVRVGKVSFCSPNLANAYNVSS
jgi:hypothetical protein